METAGLNGKIGDFLYISGTNMNRLIKEKPMYIKDKDNHYYYGTFAPEEYYNQSINEQDRFNEMLKKQNEEFDKLKQRKNDQLNEIISKIPEAYIYKSQINNYDNPKLVNIKQFSETNKKMNRYLTKGLNTLNLISSMNIIEKNEKFEPKKIINIIYDSFTNNAFNFGDNWDENKDINKEFENVIKIALSLGIHKSVLIETTKSALEPYKATKLVNKLVSIKQQQNAKSIVFN